MESVGEHIDHWSARSNWTTGQVGLVVTVNLTNTEWSFTLWSVPGKELTDQSEVDGFTITHSDVIQGL